MTAEVMLYAGSALIMAWGVGHLVPTPGIVAGFGEISVDNRRIITMEWVAEGLTLIFVGAVVLITALLGGGQSQVARGVYLAVAAMLVLLAGLSLLTGARTPVLPMKLCPLVKSTSATLIVLGALL
jgi:hypothetical protein